MGISTFPAGSSGLSTAQTKWVLLSRDDGQTATATRTISNISQNYNTLKLVASGFTCASNYGFGFRFNGQSTGYSENFRYFTNVNYPQGGYNINTDVGGGNFGDNYRANQRQFHELTIYNYTSSDAKYYEYSASFNQSSNNASAGFTGTGIFSISSNSAITSVSIISNSDSTSSNNAAAGFFVFGAL